MPKPNLIGIDTMPEAEFALAQEVIDRSSGGTLPVCGVRPPGLAIMAALRVWSEIEQADDVVRIVHALNLSLRRLISANTSTSLAVSMPSFLRISGLSGRRKTLVLHSSAMVTGTVNS